MAAEGIVILSAAVLIVLFIILVWYRGKYGFLGKPLPPGDPYIFLGITIPTVVWQPYQAVGLIDTLLQLPYFGAYSFTIFGTEEKIGWEIGLVHENLIDSVKGAILSFYPQAEIDELELDEDEGEEPDEEEEPDEQTIVEGERSFMGAIDYFAPLPLATEIKADPLLAISGMMGNLEEGETITWNIRVIESDQDYNRQGFKKIRRSAVPWVLGSLFISLMGAARRELDDRPTVSNYNTGPITPPPDGAKFESHLQHRFEEKLSRPLFPTTITIQVSSPDQNRVRSLLDRMTAGATMFGREGGNRLTNYQGYPLVLCAEEVATLWHLPSEQIQSPGIERAAGAKAPLPVELITQKEGLLLGHNNYQGKRRPVYVVEQDRITHMNIVGKTRVGKTTFMHNLIHQDIATGKGVGVIDPHGDLVQSILERSVPPAREKDVVLFDLAHLGPDMALNLLYVPPGVPNHAAVGMTLGVMKKIFADQWSATRMEDALYSALAVLSTTPGSTIRDVPKLFFDDEFRSEALANSNDKVALEYWQDDYGRMSESYRMEVARPIMTRIRAFYRNPVIEKLVAAPTSLDFKGIMNEEKIFLASLAGEATQAESAVIGALLISKIQMAAMSRASTKASERKMHYLYIDEVQNFVTTSLSTMFSEAAKYGLSLTVANQFLGQLEGGTLDAILGNTGTTVMFACGSQDADDLGKYVKPTFDAQTLMNLDRFQAIVKMQQSGKSLPAFSIETPLPPEKPEDASARVARLSRPAPVAEEGVIEVTPTPLPPENPSVPDLNL